MSISRRRIFQLLSALPASAAIGCIIRATNLRVFGLLSDSRSSEDDLFIYGGNRQAGTVLEFVAGRFENFGVPIVIHSQTGMGKTALLKQFISHSRKRVTGVNIVHMTAEAFMEDYKRASKVGLLNVLRIGILSADIVIIEDVQILEENKLVQAELVRLSDLLLAANKVVFFSCDEKPQNLDGIIRSFEILLSTSIVLNISPPLPNDFDGLIKQLANRHDARISGRMAIHIADHHSGNIREIEGSILREKTTQYLSKCGG